MRRALYASGGVHAAIILWVAIGGSLFRPSPDVEFEVTGVTLLSVQEFESLTQNTSVAPLVAEAPVAPTQAEEPTTPELAPAEDPPPVQTTPQTPEPPTEDPTPTPVEPVPQTDVGDDIAALQSPSVIDPTLETSPRPTPRDAPRVAPQPAPAQEPEVETAPEIVENPTNDASSDTPVPAETPTAPEEANTEIVTEAETPTASIAPTASVRPTARPSRPAPTQTAETTPTTTPEPAPAPQTEDAIAAAVAAAVAEAAETAPNPPAESVPEISAGVREGFIVAVRDCWNVGALSSEALQTSVVIGFTMSREGYPDAVSMRLVSFEGGSQAAAQQAYEAGRRAILRCANQGRDGYDLPQESYARWQTVQMTFNPDGMRLR